MALWGTKSGIENMPTWLTPEERENCYATSAGWVLKHKDGTEELLVAVRGLQTRLGAANITKVSFGSGAYTAGASKQVKVTFNEKVTVTGNPTLEVTNSLGGTVTATYASINAQGTTLTFTFTAPAAGATLSIAAQSVSLAGGTITEQATGNAAAELAISAGIAGAAGTKTTVA